jgi:ribosome-binding factor A
MREASQRQRRVQELLVHEVSDIVRREVKDPRVSLVTVTDAEVSPDLRNARLFVSTLGGGAEQTAEALKGLRSAAGFIRGEFARRARLRFTPSLEFRADATLERAARIHELLASVRENESDEPAAADAGGERDPEGE